MGPKARLTARRRTAGPRRVLAGGASAVPALPPRPPPPTGRPSLCWLGSANRDTPVTAPERRGPVVRGCGRLARQRAAAGARGLRLGAELLTGTVISSARSQITPDCFPAVPPPGTRLSLPPDPASSSAVHRARPPVAPLEAHGRQRVKCGPAATVPGTQSLCPLPGPLLLPRPSHLVPSLPGPCPFFLLLPLLLLPPSYLAFFPLPAWVDEAGLSSAPQAGAKSQDPQMQTWGSCHSS